MNYILVPTKYYQWFEQYNMWVRMYYPEVFEQEPYEDISFVPD